MQFPDKVHPKFKNIGSSTMSEATTSHLPGAFLVYAEKSELAHDIYQEVTNKYSGQGIKLNEQITMKLVDLYVNIYDKMVNPDLLADIMSRVADISKDFLIESSNISSEKVEMMGVIHELRSIAGDLKRVSSDIHLKGEKEKKKQKSNIRVTTSSPPSINKPNKPGERDLVGNQGLVDGLQNNTLSMSGNADNRERNQQENNTKIDIMPGKEKGKGKEKEPESEDDEDMSDNNDKGLNTAEELSEELFIKKRQELFNQNDDSEKYISLTPVQKDQVMKTFMKFVLNIDESSKLKKIEKILLIITSKSVLISAVRKVKEMTEDQKHTIMLYVKKQYDANSIILGGMSTEIVKVDGVYSLKFI